MKMNVSLQNAYECITCLTEVNVEKKNQIQFQPQKYL